MAEAFAKQLASDVIEPGSGGTSLADEIDPMAVLVMSEKGIDMTGARPKLATEQMLSASDLIVHMGCGSEATCPFVPGVPSENWGVDDPKGGDIDAYRRVRDIVEGKVRELADRARAGRISSETIELRMEGV